jgi:hypothetical protein
MNKSSVPQPKPIPKPIPKPPDPKPVYNPGNPIRRDLPDSPDVKR